MFIGQMVLADSTQITAGQPIIAQAGRRVDEVNSETARFPSTNVRIVRERIKASFVKEKPLALVSSAACGTDLLALDIAGELGIERFVLLPTAPEVFRASSVTDRPGDWGLLFDRVIRGAHVEVLTLPEGQAGYLETNVRLLDRTQALATKCRATAEAMVVWDQKSRGTDDMTGHFLAQARQRNLPVIEISTL
jgi:hypothetical protein